jgi:type VI secretion system protein ImpL
MGARQGLTQGIDPGLLLFPEEFEGLKQGLKAFINGAFEENPYQETPILRGLFFSSGRQEGSPYSQFLKALGLIEEREVLPGTSKGLFLHDFFSRILPRDRRLSIPTRRADAWSQLTRNIGLTAWFALAVAICGLLSFSFVKNLRTLGYIRTSAEPPVFEGEILTDMQFMDRFRHGLLDVEDRNRNWLIPRFGLNESKDVEIQLKGKYCNQFDERFLSAYDKQMVDKITNMSESTPEDIFGQCINFLVKRINLLMGRLEGEDFELLSDRPQPPFEPIVRRGDQTLVPEIGKTFSTLYLSALWWRPDLGALNQEMNTLQSWLRHLLTRKRTNLHWLVAWVNASAPYWALTLDNFWGGEKGAVSDEKTVPGAFTLEGKKQIDSFLSEIESALPEPLIIAGQKQEFRVWYRKAYIGAWHDFGAIFPRGAQKFKGSEDVRLAAAVMANEGGPYFSLLHRMAEELEPFSMGDNLPPWIQLAYDFKGVRDQAAGLDTFEDKGALAKVRRKGENLIKRMEKGISGFEGGQRLESQLIAAKAFRDYQKALTEIAPASASGMEASQMAAQAFSEDRATSKSPFFAAENAVNKLRVSLGGSAQPKEKMFWNLVTGPLDYLWAFVCRETACRLQDAWEKEVLVEIHGVSDRKARDRLLFGEDGYATKFIEGQAGPYVSRSRQKGFYAKEVLNRKIALRNSFFAFYNKAVTDFIPQDETEPVKANYPVFVKGLPTDTNKKARVRPHATILEVQCGTQRQRLENLNYPVNKTFNWSPQTCGDVILEIQVGHLILSRRYTGDKAFPRFLKDFEKGSHTFSPADFPDDEPTLRRFGIQRIIVNYQFRGQGPLLALLKPKPKIRVPETIAKCWDQ